MSCPSVSDSFHLQIIPPCSISHQKTWASVTTTTNSRYNHIISILHTFSSRAHNAFSSSVKVSSLQPTATGYQAETKLGFKAGAKWQSRRGSTKERIGCSRACVSRGSPSRGLCPGWAISSASGAHGIEMPPLEERHGEAGQAVSLKNVTMWKPQGPRSQVFFCPSFASASAGRETSQPFGAGASSVVVSDRARCVGILGCDCCSTRLWGKINGGYKNSKRHNTRHFWQGKKEEASSVPSRPKRGQQLAACMGRNERGDSGWMKKWFRSQSISKELSTRMKGTEGR